MGLLSSGGGDDRLQVGMAVFALCISIVTSLMVPIVAPAYDLDTGYTYEDIFLEKAGLQAYTGESMMNMTPWALTGVYTAWNPGDEVNRDPDTGWLYGESINYSRAGYAGTTILGSTNPIYLDPEQYSNTRLNYSQEEIITTGLPPNPSLLDVWWYNFVGILGWISATETSRVDDVNYWTFNGYRYEFDPLLKIDYDDPDADDYSKTSQSDASLSIVWYKDESGQGLSAGLVLFRKTSEGLVANLSSQQIINEYDINSGYSTKYQLEYNGVYVYINIRFDQDVISSGVDLNEAFNQGRWSLAVTAKSMDNFMSISSSNTLSNSVANILDTYIKIFTLSLPSVPFFWSIVLWMIAILPTEITVLMYLSRFGVLGLGIGILGTVLLGVLGGA